MEVAFGLHNDVEQVKDKIYIMTGTKPQFMEVKYLGQVLEDGKLLSDYAPTPHGTLDVIDHDPHSLAQNGGLDDVSLVKHVTMSEEEYSKRPGTYRAWKLAQIAADPAWVAPWIKKQRELRKQEILQHGAVLSLAEAQAQFPLGSRCECSPGERRGEIKWVGYLGDGPQEFADGYVLPAIVWIGVSLDNPEGKNDGSFKGKRLFEAAAGFGGFFRPQHVQVGDFPIDDPFASSDDENEEL